MSLDESEKEIFKDVFDRIKEREDSLKCLKYRELKEKNLGIEAWLKVETIRAMKGDVIDVKNRGVDLKVKVKINEVEKNIELKAHTKFTLSEKWVNDAMRSKYGIEPDICLFLSDYSKDKDKNKIEERISAGSFEVHYEEINPNWIL